MRRHARLGERIADLRTLGERHRQQDAFDGDVSVACLLCDLLGLVENADGVAVDRRRLAGAAAGHRWDFGDQGINFALGGLRVATGGLDQACGHALLVVEQRFQQMGRRDALVMLANRNRLRRLQEPARAVGQLFKVHSILPLVLGADMVLRISDTMGGACNRS